MYPRTNYEMTEADLQELLAAMKPVPMMMVGGYAPPYQQENANSAWKKLGEKMGFDHMTVQPRPGGSRFFSAVPSEPDDVRAARLEREENEKRIAEIARLEAEVARLQGEISGLNEARDALAAPLGDGEAARA